MISIREWGQSTQKGQASEAPTNPFSSNKDHKDPLESNKLGLSKAFAGSEAPTGPEILAGTEAPPGPP